MYCLTIFVLFFIFEIWVVAISSSGCHHLFGGVLRRQRQMQSKFAATIQGNGSRRRSVERMLACNACAMRFGRGSDAKSRNIVLVFSSKIVSRSSCCIFCFELIWHCCLKLCLCSGLIVNDFCLRVFVQDSVSICCCYG